MNSPKLEKLDSAYIAEILSQATETALDFAHALSQLARYAREAPQNSAQQRATMLEVAEGLSHGIAASQEQESTLRELQKLVGDLSHG